MTRTFAALIVSVLTAFTLGGCAFNNQHGPATLADGALSATNGIVVLSTGAREKCAGPATFLKVLKKGQPYEGPEIAALSVDSFSLKSDFAGHQGNVHALSLPAGKYYLAPSLDHPYAAPVRLPRYDFVVNANEIVYLGEFFMNVQCGYSTKGTFSDMSDRDLPLVKAAKPGLKPKALRKAIAVPTGWAAGL